MTGIYKITSPSNRVYVGQSVSISRRWNDYKKSLKGNQIKLYNSIKKYGYDNHVFEIIELCNEDSLNCRERFWQEKLDCVENGLNCKYVKTKDKYGRLSKSTIQKMKDADKSYMIGNNYRLGILHTDETKKRISNSLKGQMVGDKNHMYKRFGKLNYFFGRSHSDETKEILRKKASERTEIIKMLKSYNIDRMTLLLDTETGIYYKSISEASILLSINKSTLKAMLSGKFRNSTNLIKV